VAGGILINLTVIFEPLPSLTFAPAAINNFSISFQIISAGSLEKS